MAEIKFLLTIRAPSEVVYKAITEQNGLAGWWTLDTIAEPVVGSIAEFRFGDIYHNKMRILRLVANKEAEWECIQGDKEWIDTRFIFDLEDKGDFTVLRFAHTHWQKTTDFYASCNYHWGRYMVSRKDYCETGKGDPFK